MNSFGIINLSVFISKKKSAVLSNVDAILNTTLL